MHFYALTLLAIKVHYNILTIYSQPKKSKVSSEVTIITLAQISKFVRLITTKCNHYFTISYLQILYFLLNCILYNSVFIKYLRLETYYE